MPMISVIIPFFNAKDYVTPCIKSMCRQTIQGNMELVLVDDGSTDGSLLFIKELLKGLDFHGSIKTVQHPHNLGVAEARKNGLLASEGEYVIFCDSDDWVCDNIYECLLSKAQEGGYDVVVCDYMNIYPNKPSRRSDPSFSEDMLQGLLLCNCSGNLWSKLVRRDLYFVDGFIYPTHAFCEDFAYSVQLVINASLIGYVPEPLYNYVHRNGSIVQNQSTEAILKRIEDNLANHAIVEHVVLEKGLSQKYKSELIALKLIVKNSLRPNIDKPGFYKKWMSIFPELAIDIFKSKHVSWRSRCTYLATMMGLIPMYHKIVSNAKS